MNEDPLDKESALLVRRELSESGIEQPELVWQSISADEGGSSVRLPVVCFLAGVEDPQNLCQKPASRLPRRLVAMNPATRLANDDDEFLLAGVSSIMGLWQELFRFGEHVCGRGASQRDDVWPTGIETEAGRLRGGRTTSVWLPWSAVFEFLQHGQRDAPSSLILSIAESTARDLEVVVRKPRMFLRRVRRKVPLGRAQQLDAACLSWLIMRPGRTAIEKAGSAQEILAVVREESFDNLENRVLKDFLRRAARACADYLRANYGFRSSPRYKCVEQFNRVLGRYTQEEVFAGVRSVARITSPNYVLQHDEHYAAIWRAYQDLVSRQASLEHLFEWRFRAYRDLVRLLFCSVAWSLSSDADRAFRSDNGQGLWIRQKPEMGSIFEATGWPNAIRCDQPDGCWLALVAPEHLRRDTYMGVPIREVIASLGADLAVVATHPDTNQFSLWVVWTSFGSAGTPTVSSSGRRLDETSGLLARVAGSHPTMRGLHGILVTGTPDVSRHTQRGNVSSLTVSHDYHSWRQNEVPKAQELFLELIRKK